MSFHGAIEIVASPPNPPGLRVCPAEGSPCVLFVKDDLTQEFHDAFGYRPRRTTHLTERLLQLLLLLLLARSDPERIRKLGYSPTPKGRLLLHEVGRLSLWHYRDATNNPKSLDTLRRDVATSFPRQHSGPVRFDDGSPKQVWIALDPSSIRYDSDARDAALAYIAPCMSDVVEVTGAASTPLVLAAPAPVYFDELPDAGQHLFGRQDELASLDDAWQNPNVRVLLVVGWGGIGKSALVRHWCNTLDLDVGDVAFYGWSFYRQGTQDGGASADLFFARALQTFGDPDPKSGGPLERAQRLAALLRRRRTLLVLDGIESLQDPHDRGRLRDLGLRTLLRHLAGRLNGLVVVTTRPPFQELLDCEGRSVRRLDLEALSECAAADLLASCGVHGDAEEMRRACREVGGHALTLTLLGTYLADAWKGDIRRWSNVSFPTVEGTEGRHAWRVVQAYDEWFGPGPEQAVLRLLGLFDRPAPLTSIRALRKEPVIPGVTEPLVRLDEPAWNRCLVRLRQARLIAPLEEGGALDAHPLVRAYFGAVLQRDNPTGFRAAHGRLFEHLRASGKPTPDTLHDRLGDIEPLLLAVHHGCRAGRWTEALDLYRERLRRGERHFTVYVLNAIGADLAVAQDFFDGEGRPAASLPPAEHGWLFMALGIALRALNRTEDAGRAFEQATLAHEREEQWIAAALAAANVCDLHIRCGDLRLARQVVHREIELAARTGDRFLQGLGEGHRANLHHCLGELDLARAGFAEGRRLLANAQASTGLFAFYEDVFFFQLYWDFVLDTEPERAREALADRPKHEEEWPFGLVSQQMVHARAQLVLGDIDSAKALFDEAISRFRHIGEQTWLSICLLGRAWFLIESHLGGARSDVEEALGIAVSGRLRLMECEARLLEGRAAASEGDVGAAMRASDLAAALLEETGYGCRAPDIDLLDARLALMQDDLVTARDRLARGRARVRAMGYGSREPEVRALEAALAEKQR